MTASIGLIFYQTHNKTCRNDLQALKIRQRLTSLVKIAATPKTAILQNIDKSLTVSTHTEANKHVYTNFNPGQLSLTSPWWPGETNPMTDFSFYKIVIVLG